MLYFFVLYIQTVSTGAGATVDGSSTSGVGGRILSVKTLSPDRAVRPEFHPQSAARRQHCRR